MPPQGRATVRAAPPPAMPRGAAIIVLLLVGASLAVPSVTAEPSLAGQRVTAAEAARSGGALELVRSTSSPLLLEVRAAAGGSDAPAELLAVAHDGAGAALAPRLGIEPTQLTVLHDDGSQVQTQMPGLLAAAFAPDASWLAAIDGVGALWAVDASSGQARALAAGPFIGPLVVEADGGVLLLAVSSVEAPIRSRLVRLEPGSEAPTALVDDGLVYSVQRLNDGSIAYVAHAPGGTQVRRLRGSESELMIDLGPGAINAVVAPDGRHVAWEHHGQGTLLLDLGSGERRDLASGGRPTFAPDGSAVLVRDVSESRLLALDGRLIATAGAKAGFAGCAAGCQP